MLIGDPAIFAVECHHEPVPNGARRVFGRMCIWAGGHALGDINEPQCMLNVTEGVLQRFLNRMDSLEDPDLCKLSDHEAFHFLNAALYLDDERSDEQIANDARSFSKFDFLTNGGESFDHTKSFIIADKDMLRILFEDDKNRFSRARVPREAFVSSVRAFLAWILKESEDVG